MPPMSTTWPWSSPACATSGTETVRRPARTPSLAPIALLRLLALVLFISALFDRGIGKHHPGRRGYPDGHKLSQVRRHDNSWSGRSQHLRGRPAPNYCGAGRTDTPRRYADTCHKSKQRWRHHLWISAYLGWARTPLPSSITTCKIPLAAAGKRLDEPNAAIVVSGNDFRLLNSTIFGAQVGCPGRERAQSHPAEYHHGRLRYRSLSCGCIAPRVEGCSITNCKKYGLDIEQSRDMMLENNSIVKQHQWRHPTKRVRRRH